MDTKNVSLGVGVVALLLAGWVFLHPMQVVTHDTVDNNPPPYGSVSGPDIQSPYFSVNGHVTYKYHSAMAATASTSCSFRAPREGTSTLSYAAFKISSTTGAASIWELGQSAGPDATTTLIGTKYNVGANAFASVLASTSPSAGDVLVFAPGAYLNLKQGSVQAGGIGGACDAAFELI